jgi:hypothetical protein
VGDIRHHWVGYAVLHSVTRFGIGDIRSEHAATVRRSTGRWSAIIRGLPSSPASPGGPEPAWQGRAALGMLL